MRAGTCVHFNGMGVGDEEYRTKKCKAGVCYSEHAGQPREAYFSRLPCITEFAKNPVPCPLRREPTTEELDKFHAELKKDTEHLMEAFKRIRETKLQRGQVECPACKGKLGFTISPSNGHVWGRCSTAGCLAWMQ